MLREKNLVMTLFFSKNVLLVSTFESDLAVNFIKDIISNNDIEEEYDLKKQLNLLKYLN